MRIAIVVPKFAFPKTGGVGPHARKLAEAFEKRGDTVIVLSEGKIEAGYGFATSSVGPRWSIAAAWRAIRQLEQFAPDAVVFEYTTFNFGSTSIAPLLMAALLRFRKKRVTAYVHEIFYTPGSSAVSSPFKALLWAVRDALFVSLLEITFVANVSKQRRLIRLAPLLAKKSVRVVPIGANIEPTDSTLWSSDRSTAGLILCFGVVMPRRGFERIIDVVASLVAGGHDLRLEIVGNVHDFEYAERCKAYASERGIADRFVLTGGLEDTQVSDYFSRSSIFYNANEDGLISSSGSLLTAFAHGTPVIAEANSANEPELCSCVLVAGEEKDGLRVAVARALEDGPLREDLSKRTRELYKERFSWGSITATMSGILR